MLQQVLNHELPTIHLLPLMKHQNSYVYNIFIDVKQIEEHGKNNMQQQQLSWNINITILSSLFFKSLTN